MQAQSTLLLTNLDMENIICRLCSKSFTMMFHIFMFNLW